MENLKQILSAKTAGGLSDAINHNCLISEISFPRGRFSLSIEMLKISTGMKFSLSFDLLNETISVQQGALTPCLYDMRILSKLRTSVRQAILMFINSIDISLERNIDVFAVIRENISNNGFLKSAFTADGLETLEGQEYEGMVIF
ncbi:MAG: hypothetical protein EOM23_02220 [Candidatus Moranbacteria bacterium]|nr:hypothetical protein [Candidatus Moranbacteria bacterium]